MHGKISLPISVFLAEKRCLICGFGQVGQRKFQTVRTYRPSAITICDPHLPAPLPVDSENDPCKVTTVIFKQRSWIPEDLKDVFIVFACTSSRKENDALTKICNDQNILCNNTSDPDHGNFIMPAVSRTATLYAAVGTGGASPLLAAQMRDELQVWLEQKERLASLLGKLRVIILHKGLPQPQNRAIFKSVLESPVAVWLMQGERSLCHQWLQENVPVLEKMEIEEIIGETVNVFSA